MKTITLDKFTPMSTFDIWEPRWRDRRVLLAKRRIKDHNKVIISQEKADGTRYFPEPLYISGKDAKKYKVESNGVIDVYSIPLEAFSLLIINEHPQAALW